jgi:hypothetical protein
LLDELPTPGRPIWTREGVNELRRESLPHLFAERWRIDKSQGQYVLTMGLESSSAIIAPML